VTYTFVDLEEALAELPTLRDVLGKDWINREKRTPPVESKIPLARTLRIRELRSLVISLDRRLRDLWNVKGAPDWRNRLRNNGQETRELLTEISFADLLWQRGYEFEHPDDGPDFAISIEGCSPLRVEACTPRIIGWDDDLDTRLWMLGRQFDYSVGMEPAEAEVPILSAEVSERKMQHIVDVALGRLSSANIDRSYTTQLCSDIGLKIEWSPAAHPFFRKRDAPNSSPNRAFNYVWTAADKKAKQLRDANAHTLLIGTNQLPLSDWGPYVESVRNNVPYYGYFDWSQIHPQVGRIIVYQSTYGDNAHPSVEVWERPGKETGEADQLSPFVEMLRLAGEDERKQSAKEVHDLVQRLMRREAMKRQSREPS
jgi:hypothetical protein